MNIASIPVDLDEFLLWFRQRTEEAWLHYRTTTFEDFHNSGVGGSSWHHGTKWVGGFSEEEIASAEQNWHLKFPPDYHRFLRILGAPDRAMYAVWWGSKTEMRQGERPSFYDWRKDTEAIEKAMKWSLEGLLFDVENNYWLDSWGMRPDGRESQQQQVSELVQMAPPLIPIVGHRYLVGTPFKAGNPVLSVYQSDIIVYGSDLRRFLIVELADLIGIDRNEAEQYAMVGVSRDSIALVNF